MIRAIYYAKKLVLEQVKKEHYNGLKINFSKYQKGFYWTNENINYYLNMFSNMPREKALTVIGSGDHVFNLVANGTKEIDAIDINYLTEYFALGLKKALIEKYDYYHFLYMMEHIADRQISLDELTQIIMDLLPYMELKYKIFWYEIANHNYIIQSQRKTNLNLIQMLYMNVYARNVIGNNTYLQDEYSYNIFRNKLANARISFKGMDIADIPEKIKDKKYDLILLSNCLDYIDTRWGKDWPKEKLEEYLKSLEKISNDDATIFYKYIINFMDGNEIKPDVCYDSTLTFEDVEKDAHIVYKPGIETIYDGVLVRRKN